VIVALDGPAASGKGTVARAIAARFGFAHLDTGLLYRAVARQLLASPPERPLPDDARRRAAADFARRLRIQDLVPSRLRTPEIDDLSAEIAAWTEVRDGVIGFQRAFARRPPGGARGAVLDGRDIGSVVCPDADVKVFLTAGEEARAERRLRERLLQNHRADLATVRRQIRERDRRDRERSAAPLRKAPDAMLLDTSNLGIQESVDHVAAIVESRLARLPGCVNGPRGPSGRRLRSQFRHRNLEAERGRVSPGDSPYMQVATTAARNAPTLAEFEALLDDNLGRALPKEGTVVKGEIIRIENNQAIIDVGFKTEGRVDMKEFSRPGREVEARVGDQVEVYLDRIENARGEAVLSREKANREAAWDRLERANTDGSHVEGAIFGRVKGGFSVDLGGAVAFLPGSQVDVRPVHDVSHLLHTQQQFQIVKMDRRRGNIVVSRRAVLEVSSQAERARVLEALNKGDIIEGVVKNIVDFGAFVDLGGIDGLLHVTDMAWRRVSHPSEVVKVGESVRVQVIKINRESQRISLGIRQLLPDPWDGVGVKYPIGMKLKGRVANITDFGAFVELEPGLEGLIHISEMSWTKKNVHPGKIVATSQEVEVMVINTDAERKRISLGLKQCLENPWEAFSVAYPPGSSIEGPVRSITDFGLFVGLDGDIDGMVHVSDLSWDMPGEQAIKQYKRGDKVKAVVLDLDSAKERISLGIKQIESDPFADATAGLTKGSDVTATVTNVDEGGIEVSLGGFACYIRRNELGRDRGDRRPERFSVDEQVRVRVVSVNHANRQISLSVKAREIAEEQDIPVLFSVHDVALARTYSQRIIGLRDGKKIFDEKTSALDHRSVERIYRFGADDAGASSVQ